jgi:hypothetical protein
VLGFDQASLGLNREYLLKGFEDEIVQQYYKYMLDAAAVLGAGALFTKPVTQILRFLEKI